MQPDDDRRAPRPPPTRQSLFIADRASAMGAALRRAEAVGQPRIPRIHPELVPDRPLPVKLGPDPAGDMSRLKPDQTRPVERPPETDEQLAVRTPQFFLRNTMRLDRYADPDWIETTRIPVRDLGHWDDLRDAARCAARRVLPEFDSASTLLDMHLAERQVVMVESRWHEVFGRPDPID